MIHVYIWTKKHSWCALRPSAFALTCRLVSCLYSQTSCILIPRGNTITLEEYSVLSWFLLAWLYLLISMCRAWTGILFFFVWGSSLCFPLLMLWYHSAICTPMNSAIHIARALQSYLFTENRSHPAFVISSANWRLVCHIPCDIDFSHHLIVCIIVSMSSSVPIMTCIR